MRPLCFALLVAAFSLASAMGTATAETTEPLQLCTPISTGDCAAPPHWLFQPHIDTPVRSVGQQIAGTVVLSVVVDANGLLTGIEVQKSTDDALKEAVLKSAKKWRFVAGTLKGKFVAVQMRIIVQFRGTGSPEVLEAPWRAAWVEMADLQKLFDQASEAYSRRDYKQAAATARELISDEPLYKRIRFILAGALMGMDDFEDAETVLKEEIKLDPKSPFAYDQLGFAYQRQYKYDEAIEQFKKQVEVTPQAYDPNASLGVLLGTRRRCGEAMPFLQKASELSPGQARILLSQGLCEIDMGNAAKGISDVEQAASQSSSSSWLNEAAYQLAERNAGLDDAQRWAESAVKIESTFLHDVSLDHATPAQMRLVNGLGNYWDTLGWIYFRKGKNDLALKYVDASWRMHPTATRGDHLGQIYEKLGQREDAIRSYAMGIASIDLSKRGNSSPEDLAETREKLTHLVGQEAQVATAIEQGRHALEALNAVELENPTKQTGSAEFMMKIVGDKIVEVRQVGGGAVFAPFSAALRESPLLVRVPDEGGVEILRRGNLSCTAEVGKCHFKLLSTTEAADLATQEADAAKEKAPK